MMRASGPEPEEERFREEAGVLMLRVGLAMIDDARRTNGFETDKARLAVQINKILSSLGSGESTGGQAPPVTVTPIDAERVRLSVLLDQSLSEGAVLRTDGVLLEEYVSFGISAEAVDPGELAPKEREELRAAQKRFEARMRAPEFQGGHFLRALPVEVRPGSEIQILAVELFDDGLVIHFSHDEAEQLPLELLVEDDLGTEYYESGGSAGGVQVAHGSLTFTPAAPEGARILRVTSSSGTVKLPLGD